MNTDNTDEIRGWMGV